MKSSKVEQTKAISKKLSVTDYVFEIDNKDIGKVSVSYLFDKINIMTFKDNGKKDKANSKGAISIEVYGIDSYNREGSISFLLQLDLNELNKLDNKIIDISKYIFESFIKKPQNDYVEFLDFDFPKNNNKDIYINLSTFSILKIEKNVFIIKICRPNDLFTFFKIDFNVNKNCETSNDN